LEQPDTYRIGIAWPEKVHDGIAGHSTWRGTDACKRAFGAYPAGFIQIGKVFLVHEVLDMLALLQLFGLMVARRDEGGGGPSLLRADRVVVSVRVSERLRSSGSEGKVSSPYIPGREAAGEGTVKTLAATLVSGFLLPDRYERAVVTRFWIVWW
jgi:hypothetical protein